MARKISWSPRALDDLSNIVEFYHERGVSNLNEVIVLPILRSIETLRYFALSGRPRKRTGYRSLIHPPYRVEYRIEKKMIIIAAIWDTRRNPNDLPGI
jgi:plasmid stabilization system protein ParE